MAKHSVPRRIRYSETAPFGRRQLVRLDANAEAATGAAGVSALQSVEAAKIVRRAWMGSDWLRNALGAEKHAALNSDAEKQAGLEARVRRSLIDAAHNTDHQAGWLAVQTAGMDEYEPGMIMGVALTKDDVSGSPAARAAKRLLRPDKVYACVSDVDVDPFDQESGIGTALFDASLRSFSPDRVPTTFVLGRNPRLIARLGRLGFEQTGVSMRTDLFGEDMPLPEARLQADTVEAVRGRLVEEFSWLADAQVEY